MAVLPYSAVINSGSPSSILSSFYRQILSDIGMKKGFFESKLDRYVTQLVIQKEIELDKVNSKRGNLFNELMSDKMTWEVFNKGLHLLGVREFTFYVVSLGTPNETVGKVTVDLQKPDGGRTALADLLSDIKHQMDLDPMVHSRLMSEYLNRLGNGDTSDLAQRRGSFNKELKAPVISWSVFMKALDMLNIWHFYIVINVSFAGIKKSAHARQISLSDE